MRTRSQLGWLNLPHLQIIPPPVTAKQRMVTIPGDQHGDGINGYRGKDFQKRKVIRREWKAPRERSTSGPGSEYDDGEELDDGDNRTYKEHEGFESLRPIVLQSCIN